MGARSAGAVFAAVLLGGLLAFGVAHRVGWTGGEQTVATVVDIPAPQSSSGAAAVVSAARPLPGNGFDPSRIYAGRSSGVVTIISIFNGASVLAGGQSQGSGFVVSPDGYILTNSHVITNAGESQTKVQPADTLYVEFQDGDRVPARIVGWDVFDDVGLIRVDPGAHPLDPVPLGDSSRVVVGQPVAAIGSPFGNENSLSVGVVSATRRSPDSLTSRYSLVDAIQTDAPINHGNSGGPLFDALGRVIGITAQIRSNSGNAEGVGFAVPINSARRSMVQLIERGKVTYAYVGVTTVDLTPTLAEHFGVPVRYGAAIASVGDGTPADRAGLRAGNDETFEGIEFPRGGDVIVAIDGRVVRNKEDVVRFVTDTLKPGQVARLTIVRDGKRRTVAVRLGTRERDG